VVAAVQKKMRVFITNIRYTQYLKPPLISLSTMGKSCPTTTAVAFVAAASLALLAPVATDAFAPSLIPSGGTVAPSQERRQQQSNGPSGFALSPLRLSSTAGDAAPPLPPGIQNLPTELPDSLSDAASIAANACQQLSVTTGTSFRCRVDFDTSVGDETYTTLKSSTEFMQQFVSSLCLASIEGVREWKMDGAMKLVQAKADLRDLRERAQEMGLGGVDEGDDVNFGDYPGDEATENKTEEAPVSEEEIRMAEKEAELLQIIANEGTDPSSKWAGPKLRIYMPDEGSAALARRDWASTVPPCVEFSSCGGIQVADVSKDAIIIFYCPRASEAEFVEEILYKTEEERGDGLRMSVMVNPLLVDMGVTGFGMAGRRLRERLIDGLIPAYYLRTLPWGALTRVWPQLFTVWQEDEEAEGGYRMIKAMDRLPSNPEVEDIYDIENGDMSAPQDGLGFLNALGDFVNGMTKL